MTDTGPRFGISSQLSLFGHPQPISFGFPDWRVEIIDVHTAREIIKKNHYSHTFINNSTDHHGLFVDGELMGVLDWGPGLNPASGGALCLELNLTNGASLVECGWMTGLGATRKAARFPTASSYCANHGLTWDGCNHSRTSGVDAWVWSIRRLTFGFLVRMKAPFTNWMVRCSIKSPPLCGVKSWRSGQTHSDYRHG